MTNLLLSIVAWGGPTAIVLAWLNRRKTKAEVEQILANTYGQMIADLQKQVELQRVVNEKDREYYKNRIGQLETDYKALRESFLKTDELNSKYFDMIKTYRERNEALVEENKQLHHEITRLKTAILRQEAKYKEQIYETVNNSDAGGVDA